MAPSGQRGSYDVTLIQSISKGRVRVGSQSLTFSANLVRGTPPHACSPPTGSRGPSR